MSLIRFNMYVSDPMSHSIKNETVYKFNNRNVDRIRQYILSGQVINIINAFHGLDIVICYTCLDIIKRIQDIQYGLLTMDLQFNWTSHCGTKYLRIGKRTRTRSSNHETVFFLPQGNDLHLSKSIQAYRW